MKILINALMFLVISLFYEKNAFPLTDYQIQSMCRKEKRKSKCITDLKIKKVNLNKGERIEIPVVPFKK